MKKTDKTLQQYCRVIFFVVDTLDINAPILDIIYFLFHQKKPNLSHYAGNMKNGLGGIEQVLDIFTAIW